MRLPRAPHELFAPGSLDGQIGRQFTLLGRPVRVVAVNVTEAGDGDIEIEGDLRLYVSPAGSFRFEDPNDAPV